MKILALDVGSKSCGIAWSDNQQVVVQGSECFYFQDQDWKALINHLKYNYLNKQVEKIIIGMPLLPSGDKSSTSLMIEKFYWKLTKEVKINILFVDEFKTTKNAHKIMIDAGLSSKKRKKHKDKLAAVLILQNYLDRNQL